MTDTKRTYVAIENNSGYVWGVAAGETPVAALHEMVRDVDPYNHHEFERSGHRATISNACGFHLYEVPEGVDASDLTADDAEVVYSWKVDSLGFYTKVDALDAVA